VLDLAEPWDKPLCHLCVDLFVVIVFCKNSVKEDEASFKAQAEIQKELDRRPLETVGRSQRKMRSRRS
jgi:hypothetical protein